MFFFALAAAHAADFAPGEFPHHQLTEVLAKYVDAGGLVDYKGIAADRAGLDAYVKLVAEVSPKSDPKLFPTREDALAYYINAYNALAITGVIDRPGLGSVQDNLFDFFYGTTYVVGKKKINLYKLENKVVRKEFGDPRIHVALNCQSYGCPRLPQKAFEPKTLNEDLDAAAKEFATNPKKAYVQDGVVHVSQILEWYGGDFEAAGGPVAWLNQYGANLPTDAKVQFIPYDWSLSKQEGRGP
ncbi:MAG: DUF547 domain-containing protein [Myxococcota bacterium]